MAAQWEIVEWFGDVQGVKNVGISYAEDVMITSSDGKLVADLMEVAPQDTVDLELDQPVFSIAWRDSAGMHADVLRLEP